MSVWPVRCLVFAAVMLPVLCAVLVVLASGVCGPGRPDYHPYLSERILTCNNSASAWARVVPWMAVFAFAAQLPSWWCTYMQITVLAEDTRGAPAAAFGALALAALAGITAVVVFGLGDDGFYKIEHVAGAATWFGSTLLMHALTLLAYARIHRHSELYSYSTATYGVLVIVFVVFYVPDYPVSAPIQWALIFPMISMSATNLAIGFTITRCAPDCVAAA